MALSRYGVLVGRVVDSKPERGQDTPHYQIHVSAAGVEYRVAVNVESMQAPSELLFAADENFDHPVLSSMRRVSDGFTPLASNSLSGALDYIRGNLFDRTSMKAVPPNAAGPDNDLADKLAHFVNRAQFDPNARIYAFGERWGPENNKPDKIFGFSPGNGVHDVHMNQGNSAQFAKDDGVWQDGGLLLHFPDSNQWVAVFLAFQSQAWHTDDVTGHTSGTVANPGSGPRPGPAEPDHDVRIIAALVNPRGPAPEQETVTLLNATPNDLDLSGWQLLDRNNQAFEIENTILAAGETVRLSLAPPIALGNQGGLLTLVNQDRLKVDGVSYTKAQARNEGWTVTFR